LPDAEAAFLRKWNDDEKPAISFYDALRYVSFCGNLNSCSVWENSDRKLKHVVVFVAWTIKNWNRRYLEANNAKAANLNELQDIF